MKPRITNAKWKRVRALLPNPCPIGQPFEGPNGFTLTMLANGSIDLRRAVKLLDEDTHKVTRVDRVTTTGNERFIGYETALAL